MTDIVEHVQPGSAPIGMVAVTYSTRAEATLAALSARHVPDDTSHACAGCGLTWPCPDRRILDQEGTA